MPEPTMAITYAELAELHKEIWNAKMLGAQTEVKYIDDRCAGGSIANPTYKRLQQRRSELVANIEFYKKELSRWSSASNLTHKELSDIAEERGLPVIIFPDLEAALVGYINDQALDGSDTIRAVYNYDKVIASLVKQGMTDEQAQEWFSFNTLRTAECFSAERKAPIFLYTE